MSITPEKQLEIVRKAWGPGKKEGYCFFPWVRGDAKDSHERKLSFKEGPAYKWPQDKNRIVQHLKDHSGDDVFWCPMLFEAPYRRAEFGLEERSLWADLDEVDPRAIEDYPPTIAWETSPDRYQGLWLLGGEFIYGASGPGMVNQRLTYHLDADPSGWDTTQLLRLPGWPNHKPERRLEDGSPSPAKLLWTNGRVYEATDFAALPTIEVTTPLSDIIETELDRIDRHALWARVKMRLPHRARELYEAREVAGDRSEQLWYLIRCIADAGCSVSEIVALVRDTVWNKFADRADELKRLTHEAAKAIAQRTPETEKKLEREREDEGLERPRPVNLFELVRNLEPPEWLVEQVLTEGACCFIAGQPKSFKSWVALDLALSIGSGMKFLNHFDVRHPGPVLYIQEEDRAPMIQDRLAKVWAGKTGDRLELDESGTLWWVGKEEIPDPDVDGVIGSGLTLSDEGWLEWLDECMGARDYRLVMMDPLGLIMGDVEDRMGPINNRVLRPLRQLGSKHDCGVLLVHHEKKGSNDAGERGGQRMMGSAAYHAWADDALYLRRTRTNTVSVEQESKHANLKGFELIGVDGVDWQPIIEQEAPQRRERTLEVPPVQNRPSTNGHKPRSEATYRERLLEAFERLGTGEFTTAQVASEAQVPAPQASVRLKKMMEKGEIKGTKLTGKGTWGTSHRMVWTKKG